MPNNYIHKLKSTAQFLPMFLFDVWASHQEERQCVYQRLHETRLYNTFLSTMVICLEDPRGQKWQAILALSARVMFGRL